MDVRSSTRHARVYHPEVASARQRHRRMKAMFKVLLIILALGAIVSVSVALTVLFTGGYR